MRHRRGYAGHERHHFFVIAGAERQFADLDAVDQALRRGRLGVDLLSVGLHVHRLVHAVRRQLSAHRQAIIHVQFDSPLAVGSESWPGNFHLVVPDGQQRRHVLSLATARQGPDYRIAIGVGHHDFGTGNDGAAGIGDRADNGAGDFLGRKDCRHADEGGDEGDHSLESHGIPPRTRGCTQNAPPIRNSADCSCHGRKSMLY